MNGHSGNGSGGSAAGWVFLGFVVVAGYFLLTEHQAHVIQYLPFLLLLACPLIHMMHGHRGHHKDQAADAGANSRESTDKRRSACH
jgi:hypothetical protein